MGFREYHPLIQSNLKKWIFIFLFFVIILPSSASRQFLFPIPWKWKQNLFALICWMPTRDIVAALLWLTAHLASPCTACIWQPIAVIFKSQQDFAPLTGALGQFSDMVTIYKTLNWFTFCDYGSICKVTRGYVSKLTLFTYFLAVFADGFQIKTPSRHRQDL